MTRKLYLESERDSCHFSEYVMRKDNIEKITLTGHIGQLKASEEGRNGFLGKIYFHYITYY